MQSVGKVVAPHSLLSIYPVRLSVCLSVFLSLSLFISICISSLYDPRWLAPGDTEGGGVVHEFWFCCGSHDPEEVGCKKGWHMPYD